MLNSLGEETGLLASSPPSRDGSDRSILLLRSRRVSWCILPVAFVGGFGIVGTIPAILFMYQSIVCEDVHRCSPQEDETYRTVVAVATTITNALSLVMLGPVQRLSRWRQQAGLSVWLVARGSSLLLFYLACATFPRSCVRCCLSNPG